MNLFGKNKTQNWIIKLFKITDKKSAEMFDMENCILQIINSIISQNSNLKATDFDINYKDSRKTLDGFKKELKKQKEIVYSFVGFNSEKTNTYFTINNPMLNWTEKPKSSSIDISIQIASKFIELNSIELITELIIKNYDFEYGYITKLPYNYDSETERKIKKGLFFTSFNFSEKEQIWTSKKLNIIKGTLKNLYPINYINKSHLFNSEQKKIITEFGNLNEINSQIYKWNLNDLEIKKLKKTKHSELKLIE